MDDQFPESYMDRAPRWAGGYALSLPERPPSIKRVTYSLRDLVRRGLISPTAVDAFTERTLLGDVSWRLLWPHDDGLPEPQSIAERLCSARGILVFLHGWDGSGDIWEDIPALALANSPDLIALVPDINGFGGTPFVTPRPPIDRCDPPAAMVAVEQWLKLIRLHPATVHQWGDFPPRPVIFVGHSMGGAALFFVDESQWLPSELGRIAAAPALLLNDRQRQTFYRALGAGIHLSGVNDFLDRLAENVIAPRVIEALAGWGSDAVRAEHQRIYRDTPETVIARTFAAMGLLDVSFDGSTWDDFVVYLAHKDRLVGVQPALELLESLHFDPGQIRLAMGDHYFFSLGARAALHARNRSLLLADIAAMVRRMQARLENGAVR